MKRIYNIHQPFSRINFKPVFFMEPAKIKSLDFKGYKHVKRVSLRMFQKLS